MAPAFVPPLEVGETVYGWCAFLHQLCTSTSAERTSQWIFGLAHAMRQHDVPCHVRWLVARLEGQLDVPTLLRQHTVLRAYLPFVSPSRLEVLLQAATQGLPFWWRQALQSSRSRPVFHPLRLCPACVESDRQRLRRAIWHVEHQLPGAYCCILHGCLLHHASAPTRRWVTPEQALVYSSVFELNLRDGMVCSEVARAVGRHDHISVQLLRGAILTRLRSMGVLHSVSRVSHERLETWFKRTAVSRLCRESTTGLSTLADGSWIAAQLWRHHRNHAARWIVLWSALDWSDGSAAGEALDAACRGQIDDGLSQLVLDYRSGSEPQTPAKVLHSLEDAGSYAEAVDRIGCTRTDLSRWLEADRSLRLHWQSRLAQLRLIARIQARTLRSGRHREDSVPGELPAPAQQRSLF